MKPILFLVALFFSVQLSFAQKPTLKGEKKYAVPIKPPVLKTQMGILSDSVYAPVEQVKALLGAPLKVTDVNNQPLTLTYYQFLYKRKAVREDEKTGKLIPTTSTVSDYFTSTPLPEKWVKIIREELVAGEELYFFDIIVKDKQGKPFYAPNLKIITN